MRLLLRTWVESDMEVKDDRGICVHRWWSVHVCECVCKREEGGGENGEEKGKEEGEGGGEIAL